MRPPARFGRDGVQRSAEEERELDQLCAAAFADGSPGAKVLDYLRSITLHLVAGPAVSDAELRHLEGQRYLVSLIQRRRDAGRNQPSP